MRGADGYNKALFTTTTRLDQFVPANHSLHPIRTWRNEALAKVDAHFPAMYEANVNDRRPNIVTSQLMCHVDLGALAPPIISA